MEDADNDRQKKCHKCGLVKGISDFSKNKNRKDGLQLWCKECFKENDRKRYAENPEKKLESCRRYRERHPERIRESSRRRYVENAETINEGKRKRYRENPESHREASRRWYADNAENVKEADRKWREENPEEAKRISREASRKRRAENPEAVQEYNQKWYAENAESEREKARMRYSENAEERKAGSKRWRLDNPGKGRAYSSKKRALKKSAMDLKDAKAIAEFYEYVHNAPRIKCWLCGKNIPKGDRHVDHVQPLSKNGRHAMINLRPAHKKCNLSKQDKPPEKVTGQLELFAHMMVKPAA